MFITKKHLSRRTLMRGAGVALALPLLDAMVPAMTALAQTPLRRSCAPASSTFRTARSCTTPRTAPRSTAGRRAAAATSFKLSPILKSLEPYKKYVNSFGNLENAASAGSVHSINPATWLSGVRPDSSAARRQHGDDARPGNRQTHRPGNGAALARTRVRNHDAGRRLRRGAGGCYYSTTLSFRNANSPLPMEFNPRKVFLQLFGEGDTSAERDAIIQQEASILDLIAERTRALQSSLGASDKQLLEGYLDNVREIERRVELAASQDLSNLDVPTAPVGELDNFDEQVKLMFDLLALAYQADLTRVASYIMVAEGTNRTYNHIGVPDAFHPLSHHANDLETPPQARR